MKIEIIPQTQMNRPTIGQYITDLLGHNDVPRWSRDHLYIEIDISDPHLQVGDVYVYYCTGCRCDHVRYIDYSTPRHLFEESLTLTITRLFRRTS